jgi:acetylornithine deacetylase/succinyl-diaminopimelate desuccinylase-like protein
LLSTLADLEIATFAVDEVVEGTQTGWSEGVLTLALPQLAVGAGSYPALAEATVEVVHPDDHVRISNVLDGYFMNLARSHTVVFGPGHLCNAHRADGSVQVADIVACTRSLAALIEGSRTWLPAAES